MNRRKCLEIKKTIFMKTVFLRIGDISDNGHVTIIDEDRLCYIVKNESKGASGLRTISKSLLSEFIDYVRTNPQTKAKSVY